MSGLRIAAWGVAAATFVFPALAVPGVGGVRGWLRPCWVRAIAGGGPTVEVAISCEW